MAETAAAAPPSAGSVAASSPSLSMARAIPHSPESLAAMSPMDLFVSQLSCEQSLEARVDAMHRLKIVADAMGTDATLGTLIPFLSSNIMSDGNGNGGGGGPTAAVGLDQEDEILLLLAEKLGEMVPHLIPGPKAMPLLPILEKLAGVEETVVRDKAVESINKIVPLLIPSPGSAEEKKTEKGHASAMLLLAMAKRLSGADWFTSKVSAAGVLPTIYSYLDQTLPQSNEQMNNANGEGGGGGGGMGPMSTTGEEARRELRHLYKDLAEDDTPMVRRSAARHLGRFVEAIAGIPRITEKNMMSRNPPRLTAARRTSVLEDCVPLFQELSRDEQDSVRLLAVAAAGSVGRALGMDAGLNSDLVLPVVRAGCVDLSWRVRHNLAKEFSAVASSFGFHFHQSAMARQTEVFLCYSGLLQDAEAEVRTAAVGNLAHMTYLGGGELFMAHIAPILPPLAADPVMEVRSKLAQAMMDCCGADEYEDGFVGNDGKARLSDTVILQVFRPLLEGFLNDEFAEVQLHVLGKLSRVSHLFKKMDVVVNSILQMSKSQNWRVREAVSHLLPHLGDSMGMAFFKEHLLDLWLKLLMDQVNNVRLACVRGMQKLLSVAGAQWLQAEILPHYRRIYEDSGQSYLTRITILRCYTTLASCEEAGRNASFLEEVLVMLLTALDDGVANVRMISARGLGDLCQFCDEAVLAAKVRPALQARVTEDDDDDCRYFSQLSIDKCS